MSYYTVDLSQIPWGLKSKSNKSAFVPKVANWCRSQNIQYHLRWEAKGGTYKNPCTGRWLRGEMVTGVHFMSEEDFVAFKLRWF